MSELERALYVLTWTAHFGLATYVLLGAAWIAVANLRGPARPGSAAAAFADWLPFALSGVITLGVAPLLFVQLIDRERFYTANLLLSHRWMAMLPALVVGFYGLYVARSERLPAAARRALPFLVLACFVFTAWTWTENHVLSLADREVWVEMYAEGALIHADAAVPLRVALWLGAAAAIGPSLLRVQLAWARTTETPERWSAAAASLRTARVVGLAGLVAVAALLPLQRPAPPASVWAWTLGAGWLVSVAAWLLPGASARAGERPRAAATSVGAVLLAAGLAFWRETVRARSVVGYPAGGESDQRGGFALFVAALVIGVLVSLWCLRIASKAEPREGRGA